MEQFYDQERGISPNLSPQEALLNLKFFNENRSPWQNWFTEELIQGRGRLLEEAGFEPGDWVFYCNLPPDKKIANPQDYLIPLRDRFPIGVQLIIVRGAIEEKYGRVMLNYKLIPQPDWFTVFAGPLRIFLPSPN